MPKEKTKPTQQMKLSTFCEACDMNEDTVRKFVRISGFPAYKIGKCWYIDIGKYEK